LKQFAPNKKIFRLRLGYSRAIKETSGVRWQHSAWNADKCL